MQKMKKKIITLSLYNQHIRLRQANKKIQQHYREREREKQHNNKMEKKLRARSSVIENSKKININIY